MMKSRPRGRNHMKSQLLAMKMQGAMKSLPDVAKLLELHRSAQRTQDRVAFQYAHHPKNPHKATIKFERRLYRPPCTWILTMRETYAWAKLPPEVYDQWAKHVQGTYYREIERVRDVDLESPRTCPLCQLFFSNRQQLFFHDCT